MATTAVMSPVAVASDLPPPSSPRTSIIGTRNGPQGSPRARKRLTLHFPILSPNSLSDRQFTRSPTPPRAGSLQGSPRTSSSDGSPTDSTSFLTTLAAQERRVLELKEELQKAEVELSRLKRQWAQYEAGRKKDEMHQIERMRPLTSQSMHYDGADENAGMTPAAALKASLENGTDRPFARKSTQRVFSGSRHTRALSLLSPNAYGNRLPRSPPRKRAQSPTIPSTENDSKLRSEVRLSSLSLGEHETSFSRTYRLLAGPMSAPPPRDVFMNNGKKIASDFKAGLFTFWEDIRQATVGDEGVNGMETRVHTKGSSIKGSSAKKTSSRPRPVVSPTHTPVKKKGANLSERRGTAIHNLQTSTPTRKTHHRNHSSPARENEGRSFWNEFDLETPATSTASKGIPITTNLPLLPKPPTELPASLLPTELPAKLPATHPTELPAPLPTTSNLSPPTNLSKALPPTPSRPKSSMKPTVLDVDDNWDVWDSPMSMSIPIPSSRKKANSPEPSSSTSSTQRSGGGGSDRKQQRRPAALGIGTGDGNGNGDGERGLPWPELKKLSLNPARLSRNLSDLVREWESPVSPLGAADDANMKLAGLDDLAVASPGF